MEYHGGSKIQGLFSSFAMMKRSDLIYLKDVDINELVSEFTNRARCDGTKFVLESQGVHTILE